MPPARRRIADRERRARLSQRGAGEISVEVEVGAPAADVFAAAADWERQSSWVAFTQVSVVRGDGRSVGSLIDAFTGIGRVGFLDTMEVVRYEAPHRIDVLHLGRVVRGPGSFVVTELSDRRALLCWQEWLHPPLGRFGLLAWPAVRFAVRVGLRRSLRAFAREVEGAA